MVILTGYRYSSLNDCLGDYQRVRRFRHRTAFGVVDSLP